MTGGKEKALNIAWFAAEARRVIDRSAGPGLPFERAGEGSETAKRAALLEWLATDAPSLPEPKRRDILRRSYLARAAELGQEAQRAGSGRAQRAGSERRRVARRPRLASVRVAAAAAIVIAVLIVTGVSSTWAMPGNPLYSVKRWIEDAYLLVLPAGETRAGTYLSFADRRIEEFEYAESEGMSDWYYPLAADAQKRLGDTYDESSSLDGKAGEALRRKARVSATRLEALLKRASPALTSGQRSELERGLGRIRKQLDAPNGVFEENGQSVPPGPGGDRQKGQTENGEVQPGGDQTRPAGPEQQRSPAGQTETDQQQQQQQQQSTERRSGNQYR